MSDDQSKPLESSQEDILHIDFEQVEQISQVFFEESKDILDNLDSLILKIEETPDDRDQINVLFRRVHTLKGSVGAVPGGQLLGSLAHEFEALLNRIKKEQRVVPKTCIDLFLHSSRILKILAVSLREKRELYPEELSEAIELISQYGGFEFEDDAHAPRMAKSNKSKALASDNDDGVWLSTRQMNEMLKLSGELLVLKNFFAMMSQTVSFRAEPDLYERRQTDFSQGLTKICEQFQSQVQSIRKEKAEECLQGLPILVRQTATELNKTVQFESKGLDLLIDKSLGKDLNDMLVHMVRNSIDHGMEDQFERTVQGKPSIGTISLELAENNGLIHMYFSDDGKGLDRERILNRALQNSLVSADKVAELSDEDIYKFIFQAGFSTKDKVTTMSGRGVGMDVVLTTVEKYGGRIHIQSEAGMKTFFHLEIPVPQHILVEQSLLCRWQDFQLAVPLRSVAHITSCAPLQITKVDYFRFCQYGGQTVPLMHYHEIAGQKLVLDEAAVRASSAIFIKVKDTVLALLVDKVESQADLVVKPFSKIVKPVRGFKGISVLADEKVCYIVHPEEMIGLMQNQSVPDLAKKEERSAA